MSFGLFLCNRCEKRFGSNCWKNYPILLDTQDNLSPSASTSQKVPSTPPPMFPSPFEFVMEFDATATMDAMDMDDNYQSDEYSGQAILPPIYTEHFCGASKIFGEGETFMDIFDKDGNAENQKMNLYYPFTSQTEWELASFLLKSGLSMVATDEFLKLQLVSTCILL